MSKKTITSQKFQNRSVGGLSSQLRQLYRPDRAPYVKGKARKPTCVFCDAEKATRSSFQNLRVFKTQLSMVLLNKYPYNVGHLLVLPRRHVGFLNGLSYEELHDLMDTLTLSEKLLKEIYQPMGLNVGLNLGAAAGAGIPDHLHFHVIPRWSGDLNFFPLIAQSKVLIEDLVVTYRKLKKAFAPYGSS